MMLTGKFFEHNLITHLNWLSTTRENSGEICGFEEIENMRIYFRDCLEEIIKNNNGNPLPDRFSLEKLKTIYERSDFDWQDYGKYADFCKWLVNYVDDS